MTLRIKSGKQFQVPTGYDWLLKHGLAGFEAFGPLQPWHYLDVQFAFVVQDVWPHGPHPQPLVAFARRQDCDDLACFELDENGVGGRVAVIHGWTAEGYSVVVVYGDFWEWLKSVVDDIGEWVEMGC